MALSSLGFIAQKGVGEEEFISRIPCHTWLCARSATGGFLAEGSNDDAQWDWYWVIGGRLLVGPSVVIG
jgi:hypothetical protein